MIHFTHSQQLYNRLSQINSSQKKETFSDLFGFILRNEYFFPYMPFAKSFIIDVKLVKVRMGIKANGSCGRKKEMRLNVTGWCSDHGKVTGTRTILGGHFREVWHFIEGWNLTCMLCSTLRKSFIPVRCCTSWKMATSRVGVMAMERVRSTRAKRDHRRFKNPWTNSRKRMNIRACIRLGVDHITMRNTYLHNKLPRVGSCHGGALPSCQDPYGPDVERCRAKETTQDYTLKTSMTRLHRLTPQREDYSFDCIYTYEDKDVKVFFSSKVNLLVRILEQYVL